MTPARRTRKPNGRRGANGGAGRSDLGIDDAAPAYAALDLGTNNCRLLVATPDGASGFNVIDSYSRIVRLGEGMAASGRLSDAAMARTLEALHTCADVIRRNGARRVRAIATEACRRAENAAEFLARAIEDTGIELEPVSAHEEAELTFAGCRPLLDSDRPYALVFDIGGGSSELMLIDQSGAHQPHITAYHSIPEGVVTLAERYGGGTVPSELYEEVVAAIDVWLHAFDQDTGLSGHAAAGRVTMLGTSGTVTTLGSLHLGLRRYLRSRVDGMVIDFDSIRRLSQRLAGMPVETRASYPCIGAERADLVVMGCAILEAVCRRWPVGRLRVADRGIREGALLGMMTADGCITPPLPRKRMVAAARGALAGGDGARPAES